MEFTQDTLYILIGGFVGFTSSTIGALVDYLISRKRDVTKVRLPGCVVLVTGGLGLAGLLTAIIAFILTQNLRPIILAGIGVLGGFFITFIILALAWLLISKQGKKHNYLAPR